MGPNGVGSRLLADFQLAQFGGRSDELASRKRTFPVVIITALSACSSGEQRTVSSEQ